MTEDLKKDPFARSVSSSGPPEEQRRHSALSIESDEIHVALKKERKFEGHS